MIEIIFLLAEEKRNSLSGERERNKKSLAYLYILTVKNPTAVVDLTDRKNNETASISRNPKPSNNQGGMAQIGKHYGYPAESNSGVHRVVCMHSFFLCLPT